MEPIYSSTISQHNAAQIEKVIGMSDFPPIILSFDNYHYFEYPNLYD